MRYFRRPFLALLLLGPGLQAANYTWIPTTSGTWDAANWGGVAPTFSDTAVINNSGTASLPVGVSGSFRILFVSGTLSGEKGTISISGGLLSGTTSFLGAVAGSNGSATVTSGTWANSSNLTIGASGTGTLVVNGGLVSVTGTTTVANTGAGSRGRSRA